jgi:hypothetical protein
VFEVDRLTIVSANEVQTEPLSAAPEGLRALPWAGVKLAGVRRHRSASEQRESGPLQIHRVLVPHPSSEDVGIVDTCTHRIVDAWRKDARKPLM